MVGISCGDEGKGRFVGELAREAAAEGLVPVCVRANGGNNAGHTWIDSQGRVFKFHLLPSGAAEPTGINVIGSGVVVDLKTLAAEIDDCVARGLHEPMLYISLQAHLVLAVHRMADEATERQRGDGKIGTTGRGIGPAYAARANRHGVTLGLLLHSPEVFQRLYHQQMDYYEKVMGEVVKDGEEEILKPKKLDQRFREEELAALTALGERFRENALDTGAYLQDVAEKVDTHRIILEGANATMIDLTYGSYPFVTSSDCTVGGLCSGSGLPPGRLAGGEVYGVFKAYTTKVGAGPFPTEDTDPEVGGRMQVKGKEFGTTTGRERRCGHIDLPALDYACKLNGVTRLVVNKADVLSGFETVKVCVGYKVDGNWLANYPVTSHELEQVTPVYETLDGWSEDLSKMTHPSELPPNALNFVRFIESHLECPVAALGVGPGESQMIKFSPLP